MIDLEFKLNEKPKKGSVLIAEPFLNDDSFSRSVIYLCDHNKDGSFGFVLNKFIHEKMDELVADFPIPNVQISAGGPVDVNNLFFIHSLGDILENSLPIDDSLCIGGDFEQLKELLKKNPTYIHKIRFFIGYSGWDVNQLEQELKENAWIILNSVPSDELMNLNNSTLWEKQLQKLGGKFKAISNFPLNPTDN